MHTGRVLPRAGEGQSGKAHGIGMAWGGEILIIPRQGAAACRHRPAWVGRADSGSTRKSAANSLEGTV